MSRLVALLALIAHFVPAQSYSTAAQPQPGFEFFGSGHIASESNALWTMSRGVIHNVNTNDHRVERRGVDGQILAQTPPAPPQQGSIIVQWTNQTLPGMVATDQALFVPTVQGIIIVHADATFQMASWQPSYPPGPVMMFRDGTGVVVVWAPNQAATRFVRVSSAGQFTHIATLNSSIYGLPSAIDVQPDGSICVLTSASIYRVEPSGFATVEIMLGSSWGQGFCPVIWNDLSGLRHMIQRNPPGSTVGNSVREVTFSPSTGLSYGPIEPCPSYVSLNVAPTVEYVAGMAAPRLIFGNSRRNGTGEFERLHNSSANDAHPAFGNYYYLEDGNPDRIMKYDPSPAPSSVMDLGGGFSVTGYNPHLTFGIPAFGTLQQLAVYGATPGMTGMHLLNIGVPTPTQLGPLVIHLDLGSAATLTYFMSNGSGANGLWIQLPPADPSLANIPLTFQSALYGAGGAFEITNGVRAILGY